MKKYDKKSAIKIIVHAAKEYEEKLNNKHFLIVYQKKSLTKTVEIGFRDMNFLHLTGVKTKLSAQQFYAACLESKLAERDFEIDNKGKVQQKLIVLTCLSKLMSHHCLVGEFINSGVYIRADYFVGDTKAILSVGFCNGNRVDYPVTLYNEDVKRLSNPTNKVLAIFSKSYKEKCYNKCTYLSKGQEIGKLKLEEDIRKRIEIVR